MATHYARKKWHYDEACDGYTPGTVTWDYSTTSDILAIVFDEGEGQSWGGKIPARKERMLIGNQRALALLAALEDWAEHDNSWFTDKVEEIP